MRHGFARDRVDALREHIDDLVCSLWFLVAESLANGDLEPLPNLRMESPMAYWLIVGPRSAQRPEIKAFCNWLLAQSRITRQTIGEVPDPDTVDDLD